MVFSFSKIYLDIVSKIILIDKFVIVKGTEKFPNII